MTKKSESMFQPKYKICVSGAAETGHCSDKALEQAEEIGRDIAKKGIVLITGATTGIPYWAAKGAKEEGGFVIGFSPASSKMDHVNRFKLPLDFHDVIVYTGFNYSGRNLVLSRSSDAVIYICGRMGTFNEFTIGFEDNKPLGVLERSGGAADMMKEMVEKSHKGMGNTIFSENPSNLLEKVVKAIKEDQTSDLDNN